ncbi:MAG: Maf family protein, partial [Flavobacteriaceae bacterium]
ELVGSEISDFLAKLKADSLKDKLAEDEILITSDTVVWHMGQSLAKAADGQEAFDMLKTLNDDKHKVITSVCFTTTKTQRLENSITEVTISSLSDDEIWHYIEEFKPFDKAGAYGIQQWIGLIGIAGIEGSYTNVVGLPTELVYSTLKDMLNY